jgi:hypothetical protein
MACVDEHCISWNIDSSCCDTWEALTAEEQCRAEVLAWSTIDALTAGRVGRCPVVMRPCLAPPCDYCAGHWLAPMIRDGRWYNQVCGTPKCSCERMCDIVFPGPVADLIEVTLDGILLDRSLFRIDNGNRLVRQDGDCWPSCQRMDLPLGEVCTMGITYVPGVKPGPAGEYAAGVLACEFSKACGGGKCRLPQGVTTIARQGVVMALSTEMFPGGMTGIREVDAWLTSVNPHHLRAPSTVWSPDLPTAGHRHTTWTAPVVTP